VIGNMERCHSPLEREVRRERNTAKLNGAAKKRVSDSVDSYSWLQKNSCQGQKALETSKTTRKETYLGQTELRVTVQLPACTWQHNIKEYITVINEQKT